MDSRNRWLFTLPDAWGNTLESDGRIGEDMSVFIEHINGIQLQHCLLILGLNPAGFSADGR